MLEMNVTNNCCCYIWTFEPPLFLLWQSDHLENVPPPPAWTSCVVASLWAIMSSGTRGNSGGGGGWNSLDPDRLWQSRRGCSQREERLPSLPIFPLASFSCFSTRHPIFSDGGGGGGGGEVFTPTGFLQLIITAGLSVRVSTFSSPPLKRSVLRSMLQSSP